MRIIGGTLKGRHLVDWEDAGIRPVRDFVRTALFNIIDDFVPDAICLDLFCGSGSLGLEALSRGARRCVFVDASADACRVVRRNLDAFDLLGLSEVIESDSRAAVSHLASRGRRFDLVWFDPPYFQGLSTATMDALADGHALTDDSVVVGATHHTEQLHESYGVLATVDRRRYGDNALTFFRRAGGEDS